MQSAKTMYIVESPINALSIEACGMPWTHALAVRGLTIETIDWSFLYGMQCVICMDADPVNERGKRPGIEARSEEHTSELQSLMRISYAVFCLKKTKHKSISLIEQHSIKS